MDPKKQRWLAYIWLTALLGFFMVGLPLMGFRSIDPFTLFILAIVIIAVIISMRFSLSKGNISRYDLSNLHLIWKDHTIREMRSYETIIRKAKISGMVFLLLVIVLVLISPKLGSFISSRIGQGISDLAVLLSVFAYVFLIVCAYTAFLLSIFGFVSYNLKQKGRLPEKELILYTEGVRYLNYFIEWYKMKSISYPVSFGASRKTARFLAPFFLMNPFRFSVATLFTVLGSAVSGTVAKITGHDGRVYFVEIRDREGFEKALIRLNRLSLLR